MKVIAITGASGYIGRHLIDALSLRPGVRINVLARRRQDGGGPQWPSNVSVMVGDLSEPASLAGFLEPGCTVVNLVYLWNAGEAINLSVTANLVQACVAAGVDRLIHCSTAAVAGRTPADLIDEATPCKPVTEYGTTKLKVEQLIVEGVRARCDVAILRPTAVFGPESEAIKKLARDLMARKRLQNYLRECLFARRRTNLVHVANVVSAILFTVDSARRFDGDVFIVSDDDDPMNNFADVSRLMTAMLGLPRARAPRIFAPPVVLSLLLRGLGRNNINPMAEFNPKKLLALGCARPVSLEAGLREYAEWYRDSTTALLAAGQAR